MTPAELRKIVEGATPGEWFQSHRKLPDGMYSTQVYTADGETVCTLHWYPKPMGKGHTQTYRDGNAAFIATARTALPALLDEVERYRFALEVIATDGLYGNDELRCDVGKVARDALQPDLMGEKDDK